MRFVFLLTFLSLIFLYNNTKAQISSGRGIIITQNADTISGIIEMSPNKKFTFAETPLQKGEELSPFQVNTIITHDGKIFRSKEIEIDGIEQRSFLQLLIEGNIKLYKLPEHPEYTYWAEDEDAILYALSNVKLTSRRNGKSYVRYSNTYKGILKNLFSEQTELYSSIDRLKYSDVALIRIYQEYYAQEGEALEVYYHKETGTKVAWGILAGMQAHALSFVATEVMDDQLSPEFSHSNDISFGLFSMIKPSFLGKRSSFRLEMRYHQTSNSNGTMTLSMSNLKAPLSYHYLILPDTKIQPYLSLGPALNFLFSINDESEIDKLNQNWLQSGRLQYGLEASAGAAWAVNENSRFFLELKFGVFNGNHLTLTDIYLAGVGDVPVQDFYGSLSENVGLFAGFQF